MKKILAFAIVLISAAALLAGALYYQCCGVKRIVLPPLEPQRNPLAVMDQAFPPRTSQVVITARLPFANLKELAQQQMPRTITGEYPLPDSAGYSGISVHPDLAFDPLSLTPEVPSAPPRIDLGLALRGTLGAKAFKWIIVRIHIPPFVDRTIKTKGPELSGTLGVSANIHGWVSPGIDPHWNFTHREHFNIDVGEAELKLLGIIPISFRGKVQDAVNRSAPEMIKKALDAATNKSPIRPEVERVWNQLYSPVKLSSQPDTYAVLVPDKVHLQRLAFDDSHYLTLRMAIDGTVKAAVLSEAPSAAQPVALPDLTIEPSIEPSFRVILPVGIQLTEINSVLKSRAPHTRLQLGKNTSVDVSNLQLLSKSGTLYAKLDVDAVNKDVSVEVVGSVYLKADVFYDSATQDMSLKNADFSVETTNELVRVASWLLHDAIRSHVKDVVKIEVGPRLIQLRRAVNERYASTSVAPGVTLKPQIDQIEFEGIRLTDNLITMGFELKGELSCDINIPAK